MDTINIMLACDSALFTEEHIAELTRDGDIRVLERVTDGARVAERANALRCDAVIFDITLPGADAIYSIGAPVIVLTREKSDASIQRAMREGAAHYMISPFDVKLVKHRVRGLGRRADPAPREDASEDIMNLFLILGIPANIKGYRYLREAVEMVLADRDIEGRITKVIYPGVARKFGTNAQCVERAMRHAIEVAWNRGRLDSANAACGQRVFDRRDKPSNGEFIALVADKIASRHTA